jgi:hypothetical protein
MSDTPRTDAVTVHSSQSVTSDYSQLEVHARQLEGELEAAKQGLSEVACDRDNWQTSACYWRDQWNKQALDRDRLIHAIRYLARECDTERNGFNGRFPDFKQFTIR